MKQLITLLLLVFIIGCNDDNDAMSNSAIDPDGVDFSIVDAEGNDLLDPNNTNENAIKHSQIKVYYKIDGESVYQFYDHLDYPGMFIIKDDYVKYPELLGGNGLYRAGIHLYYNQAKETTTVVEWNSNNRDTIRVEWVRDDFNKIYLNDELSYQRPTQFVDGKEYNYFVLEK